MDGPFPAPDGAVGSFPINRHPRGPSGLRGSCTGNAWKRNALNTKAGLAYLAAWVGAIAVWNAAPAGADALAQAAPAPSPTPTASPPPHLLQVSGFADTGYT